LPGSTFASLGRQVDFYGDEPVKLTAILLPTERIFKEIFYIPALLLLGMLILLQRRRQPLEA
jgi:hypothetical protein